MDDEAMEAMRQIMRSQAAFAGMEVLTYCFMSNHFHIFVRLDPKEMEQLDDAGLVRRFRALYGSKKCASLGLDADDLEVILKNNRASAEGIRRRLKARMGDISVFMREVKTRFTFWYKREARVGGHVLGGTFPQCSGGSGYGRATDGGGLYRLESGEGRLVKDAADYGFSGFAEACAGGSAARRGIARIEGKAVVGRSRTSATGRVYCSRTGPGMPRLRKDERTGGATEGEDGSGATAPRESGLLSKIRAFSESWVVGSVAWVERFSAAQWLAGLAEGKKGPTVSLNEGGDLTEVATVVKRH